MRLLFVLYLFLFSLNLYAINLEGINCQGQQVFFPELNKTADDLYKALEVEWWSASRDNILKSSCRKPIPTLKEINNFIAEKASGPKGTHTINGVTFENESLELIKAYEDLTTIKNLFDEVEEKNNLQELYGINPSCKKVLCALEKAFGKELGPKVLYMKLRYGFNSSEYGNKHSSRLSNQEMNILLRSVQNYPANLFPLDTNKQLTKFKNGLRLKIHSDRTVAFAAISFYDIWDDYSPEMMEYTAVHELAHYIGSELEIDDNETWLSFSGWIEKGDKWLAENETFSSLYGATEPGEDFAEAVSAYRFNPKLLKEISPEKYNYIKEVVFDGLEYSSKQGCQEENSFTYKVQQKIAEIEDPSHLISNENDYNQIISQCTEETMGYILNKPDALNALDQCIHNNGILRLALSHAFNSTDSLYEYDELVESRIRNSNLDGFPKIPMDKLQDIKRYIRNEVLDSVLEEEDLRSSVFRLYDPSEACSKMWGEFSYQSLFKNNEELEEILNPFNKRDEIGTMFTDLCEKRIRKQIKPKESTREEVETSFEHLVTVSSSEKKKLLKQRDQVYWLLFTEKERFRKLSLLSKLANQKKHQKYLQDLNKQLAKLKSQLY